MELTLNDDQQQFQDTLRRYLGARNDIDMRHAPTTEQRQRCWAEMAELGVQGLAVPEAQGGFSGAFEDMAVVAFELGREPVGTPRYEGLVLAARLFAIASGDKSALIERLVAGDMRPAFAAFEKPTEFDLSRCDTRFAIVDGILKVWGSKILVVDGDEADMLLVVGRMEADGKLAVVAVDSGEAGVERSIYSLADFTGAADIRFEGARVTAVLLSGEVAAERLNDCLDDAIIILCAATVGSLERSIELTREFLGVREQFGKPLAQLQALQHQVADLFIKTSDARSMVYRAISALYEGRNVRRRAAAGCKVKVASTARFVTGQALHLHGGIGFTTEYPIGHHFRRAFVDEKLLGDSDFHFDRLVALGQDLDN